MIKITILSNDRSFDIWFNAIQAVAVIKDSDEVSKLVYSGGGYYYVLESSESLVQRLDAFECMISYPIHSLPCRPL